MKILLLASVNAIHTKRWANSLTENGLEVFIFDFLQYEGSRNDYHSKIKTFSYNINLSFASSKEGGLAKLNYLKSIPFLKKIINEVKPDIIHCHYASSYGLLGALSNFHPLIISVWGTDIFDFPRISFFHKKILQNNFKKADFILSTSNVMAVEINKYTSKQVIVTPFGVDLLHFKPVKLKSIFKKNEIIIGTIKTLEHRYGIEYMIKSFYILVKKYSELQLRLLIVGEGSLKNKLKQLTIDLGISDKVVFTGKVPHSKVPYYYNMIAIPVFLSISESFGVSVIEASACEKPVVVSDVGGLPEVVEDGVTGIVVPARDSERAAEAIEKLIFDKVLRKKMGKSGRERVRKLYDWDKNVAQMIEIYYNVINKNNLKKF